jgi:hypothetical protein
MPTTLFANFAAQPESAAVSAGAEIPRVLYHANESFHLLFSQPWQFSAYFVAYHSRRPLKEGE